MLVLNPNTACMSVKFDPIIWCFKSPKFPHFLNYITHITNVHTPTKDLSQLTNYLQFFQFDNNDTKPYNTQPNINIAYHCTTKL